MKAQLKSTKITRKNTYPQSLSAFQQVFATVTCLTLLSGGVSLCLSMQDYISPEQASIIKTGNDTYKIGMVAICGLLGGKVVRDRKNNK
jgi:hypothetical protein